MLPITGFSFTVALTVAWLLLHLLSVATTVYMPLCADVVVARVGVAVAASDDPGQENVGVPPPDPAVAVAVNESAVPTHTVPPVTSVLTVGRVFTVKVLVVRQPVPSVYVIVTV
jgi:hypothetical protein